MITISRLLARRLRVVFSRGLGVTARSATPPIQFHADARGLSISVVGPDAGIAYHHAGQCDSSTSLAVPFELLKRCEGTKHEPVTIDRQDDEIVAQWTDDGIPQVARFPVSDCEDRLPLPDTMQENNSELPKALRDAVETADREASRYVLNCIRLRGSDGQIAGTDGRQLFVQDGFNFPWDDDLIVPACRVFTCPEINTGGSMEIGSTDKWAVLRSGPWTIHLRVEKEGRFPNVDAVIPQSSRTQSTLRLSGSDAAFLAKALRRMPSSDDVCSPITVDLNGSVAIRSKGEDQPTPTELVLTGSRRDGDAIRFNTNRDFLSRAVRLGFRDVDLSGPEAPACCRDGRRVYVWSLLGKEGAILADPDAVRIESPARIEATRASSQRPGKRTCMPAPRSCSIDRAPGDQASQTALGLIEEAVALKASLHEMLNKTNGLIAGLRRQHAPARLRRATSQSA